MEERTYAIKDELGHIVAERLSIETAMILLEALMNKYYNDWSVEYTIYPYDYKDPEDTRKEELNELLKSKETEE